MKGETRFPQDETTKTIDDLTVSHHHYLQILYKVLKIHLINRELNNHTQFLGVQAQHVCCRCITTSNSIIAWTEPTAWAAHPSPSAKMLIAAHTHTCSGIRVLLLLSVRNIFSSIQDLGPRQPAERGNLGGAMTLLEKGFFMGEIWLIEPGTPKPPPRRWSLPQDTPPEVQPLP